MKKLIIAVMALAMITASVNAQQQDYGILIFNHQIALGMTFANVQAAWGNPQSVNRSVSGYSIMEWWWYPQGLVVFYNGRVESFQQ
jgi:hypothetical protein